MHRLCRSITLLSLGLALLGGGTWAQRLGHRPPELEAVKWYNTPPLALAQLQDKAVLVEVFRTW